MLKTKSLTLYTVDKYRRNFIVAILLAMVIALLTTSCSYRLSGISGKEQLFSPLLKNISIEGVAKYDAFRIQLKEDILSHQMKVVAAQYATTRIIVKNKEIEQQTITIGDDAKAREYLLIAQVDFYIIVGKRQYPLQSLLSEITYSYYPQYVSISLNEKKRALAFLNQDLSSKLIARLRALTQA